MALLSALLWACCALALVQAQPYVADGGFDRPRPGPALTRASLAAVVDGGEARVLIGDAQGARALTLRPGETLDAATVTQLATDTVVRGVAGGDGWQGGPALYAWYERDTSTGVYRYWWSWDGERAPLLDTVQALDLAVAIGPAGPEAYLAVPAAGGARLELRRWGEDPSQVVLRSDRTLAAPSVAYDPDGERHLIVLEGATVDTPLGQTSEWALLYRRGDVELARFDGALGPPAQTVLHLDADPPVAAWTREDETVMAWPPGALERAPVAIGSGRAVAALDGALLWVSGASLIVSDLSAPGEARVNVAWSPSTVAQASAVRAEGVTYLVWSATEAGGGTRAFVSDDARALTPSWRDHLAAAFGWNPWAFTEEALGQVTGALLVGVLGTMVLLPLLWLLTLPLGRRVAERRARVLGAVLAVALVALAGGAAVARAAALGNDAWALLGGGWGFALALAIGAALPPLALRRADLEVQAGLLVSAAIGVFVSVTLIAFVAFQPWLELLGL